MSVTIQCAPVKPESFNFERREIPESPDKLFETSTSKVALQRLREAHMKNSYTERDGKAETKPDAVAIPPPYEESCLRVQLNDAPEGTRVAKCTNGLVHTLQAAYNEHLHLVLRPDDVWHAILSQFSLYVQANAEKLRKTFVAHEGKKALEIQSLGSLESADFAAMAQEMGRLLEDNVKDPDLRTWLIPKFSTTTPTDTTIASIIMMATLQKYFDYKFSLMCGIPSVTLLGTPADWDALRARVDKLTEFGEEPTKWAALLRPVCDSFVACFDQRNLDASKDFWSRVCHRDGGGSGPTYLCGWATVFTVWDKEGKWQGDGWKSSPWNINPDTQSNYGQWPIIDSEDVAPACAEVPVTVDDNGTEHHTLMLAGLPGIQVRSNEQGESVVSPASGWAMFKVPAPEK